jgi:prolyl-tRNA editing enzyme YbaK/EbsC (Cys-tRNA(Pro) deacylase)
MQSPTNPTAASFQRLLQSLGLSGQVVEFSETTRTAVDAAAAIGCEVAQIVKTLIFKTKESHQAVVVYTSGAHRVDEARIETAIGQKLDKADADFVRNVTGYAIGGVPPFGFARLPHTFMDESLLTYEVVWAAAGTSNAVFPLSPQELLQHSFAQPISVSKQPKPAP